MAFHKLNNLFDKEPPASEAPVGGSSASSADVKFLRWNDYQGTLQYLSPLFDQFKALEARVFTCQVDQLNTELDWIYVELTDRLKISGTISVPSMSK